MYLADTLSRAFLKNTIQSKAEEEAETIHATDFSLSQSPNWGKFKQKQLKMTLSNSWRKPSSVDGLTRRRKSPRLCTRIS